MMGNPTITFSKLVDLIIWENIAYLASDERRARAFAALQQSIGTQPERILSAKHSSLATIGKAGILPDVSAEKLLTIAKIAHEGFGSDLRPALKKPLPRGATTSKKGFKEVPEHWRSGRGEGTLVHPFLPSDGARLEWLAVLCRVGFADEQKNYSATLPLGSDALRSHLPRDYDSLIGAQRLLRQHGQELCKRSKPRCAECPFRTECAYNRNAALSQ